MNRANKSYFMYTCKLANEFENIVHQRQEYGPALR